MLNSIQVRTLLSPGQDSDVVLVQKVNCQPSRVWPGVTLLEFIVWTLLYEKRAYHRIHNFGHELFHTGELKACVGGKKLPVLTMTDPPPNLSMSGVDKNAHYVVTKPYVCVRVLSYIDLSIFCSECTCMLCFVFRIQEHVYLLKWSITSTHIVQYIAIVKSGCPLFFFSLAVFRNCQQELLRKRISAKQFTIKICKEHLNHR